MRRSTRALIKALARSSAWDSSAFMWTYDESGGWFDHVRPPPGAGFRVPALLVSPYARRGYVDSTPPRHHLHPRFIERNWATRAAHVGHAASSGAFDFSREPRAASIVRRATKAGGAPGRAHLGDLRGIWRGARS